MIDRRQAMGLLSGALLVPTTLSCASANEPTRGEREGIDGRGRADELLYDLPLVLRNRQLVITTIFILGMSQLWMLRTASGVDQRNENRLALGAIPFLSGLMRRTYSTGDFTANNRIGAAYADGAALFVFLFPELMIDPQVRQLVILNTLYSYQMRDNLQGADWAMMMAAMPTFCAIETVRRTVEARLKKPPSTITTAGVSGPLTSEQMDTMVLGGLVNEDSQGKSGIPVLRDIPTLKSLFSGHIHKAVDNQLLLLVRPSTVVGDSERG